MIVWGIVGFIAVILSIINVAFIVGIFIPEKHAATHSISVNLEARKLFKILCNINGYPHWRRDIRTVEVEPSTDGKFPFKAWTEHYISGDKVRFEVVRYNAQQLELEAKISPKPGDKKLAFGGTWSYEVFPKADSKSVMKITEKGEIYNPFYRTISKFITGYEAGMKNYAKMLRSTENMKLE